MKRYSLLLFDFDGTLVDTVGDIAHHANAVLKELDLPEAPVGRVKGAIGLGVHELFKGISSYFQGDVRALENAVDDFKSRYRRQPVLSTRPFPRVVETLRGPLRNVPKAIVTNKPQDITLEILATLDLLSDFDGVIGMHAGFPPKPDPASTWAMIKRLSGDSSRTVYIGDSNVDAQTCANAGIDFVWMDYGYDRLEGSATYRFSSAPEWERLVEKGVNSKK